MRTTLTIADDVLDAAKILARQSRRTVGDVVSELARASLPESQQGKVRNGVLMLPVRRPGARATLDIVNALREESE